MDTDGGMNVVLMSDLERAPAGSDIYPDRDKVIDFGDVRSIENISNSFVLFDYL
ncbi:MAG: hypothetical protein QOC87_1553 [Actinomycetota bacterium]|jgi:hypothetical protein|nr:hypothetical protein [Actinomycetota bacterium]